MEPSLAGLRSMYLVAVIAAGVVGAITLMAPAMAGRYVFGGDIDVDVFIRILGALWLAIGIVAIAGFIDPVRYLPVLLIQLLYKMGWLIFAAYPALLSGKSSIGLVVLTVLFTIWVLALMVLVPFRLLLLGGA